jgi:transcription initiation factor TFIID subunit 2
MDEDYDEDDEYNEKKLHEMALAEIERYQRMDQWQPTYRNVVSEAALDVSFPYFQICLVFMLI